jgi:predicted pyridoxine 5'-phosphate oxidase superfamily flavin-nucleotide-binding protein
MGTFHEGELEVQLQVGVAANAERIGRSIHPEIPDLARRFAADQRFVLVGAADIEGRVWATLLQGKPGFVAAASPDVIRIAARPGPDDPLAAALAEEADVGLLLIEPATRRRIRINGRSTPTPNGLDVRTREVYANCPKYIHAREVRLSPRPGELTRPVKRGAVLTADQVAWIRGADTLFLASRHPAAGADVSHRGGPEGFVTVLAPDRLILPDYAGNMMFNTLGNIAAHPEVGLLFVNFGSGDTLQLSGRARIDWDIAARATMPGAERVVEVAIDAVVEGHIAPRAESIHPSG